VINIRPACARDADFILGPLPRSVGFDLPSWRNHTEIARLFTNDLRAALDGGAIHRNRRGRGGYATGSFTYTTSLTSADPAEHTSATSPLPSTLKAAGLRAYS
jgi:hypothetical protein